MARSRADWGEVAVSLGKVAGLLAGTTVLVAVLEAVAGVPDASATYLLAVLASAMYVGTGAAISAAVGAFLLYNFLFVEPRYTFTVDDPGAFLNLLLLLVLGIAVGQLAARQRSRAEAATGREREARALFRISQVLATRTATSDVLPEIAESLRTETGVERVTIGLSQATGAERVAADTGGSEAVPRSTEDYAVLQRMPGDSPAKWMQVHPPGARVDQRRDRRVLRTMITAAGNDLGSVWATQLADQGVLSRTENRLLAAAADQIGQALEQDRLAEEARAAEVARRSDALKSALLDSVSHDLRTPLAAIRAAAGTILEGPDVVPESDRVASAAAIDREAEHLNRIVTNLLDLSRIEGGALRADLEVIDLDDAVRPLESRYRPMLFDRFLEVTAAADTPPALADPVFFEEVISNLLDNEVKFVPPGATIRVRLSPVGGFVRVSVDDSGPGVPAEALPHVFEKFYRGRPTTPGARPGTGTGLAVVHGLVEAMGGRVQARHSALGGLGIDVDLPAAGPPRVPGEEFDRPASGT